MTVISQTAVPVVTDFKQVKEHFTAIGGFKTAKGFLYFADSENNVLYAFNDRENKVKAYVMGNGGLSWIETMTFDEFKVIRPKVKK